MWQAEHVASLLSAVGANTSIVPLVSKGDVDMRPIDGTRSVGVFTKRIQEALLVNEGDVAVHSMKDLPTEAVPDLCMIASPRRETVADCLVSPDSLPLEELPEGSRVGTGSRRRAAQLLRVRPDLQILPIRGNVQTRLEKMRQGEYDAIVLAAAGIERLEMFDLPRVELSLSTMLPAPGQGALAIEVRADDAEALQTVAKINDPLSAACTLAERSMLAALHGGCLAPIAAHAIAVDGRLDLIGRVLETDGTRCLESLQSVRIDLESAVQETPVNWQDASWAVAASELGATVADELIEQGARDVIKAGRG
jgi:hydroxymethylbilane synthase